MFLLCYCTPEMMRFCERFHLPRPTPTLNLFIWRCHELVITCASHPSAPTLQRFIFIFILWRVCIEGKASYFDGEALGLRSDPQLQWLGKRAHLSRLCIVSYVWFGELNLNLITTHNVWKHSDLICLTLSHQTVYKEFIYFLSVYVNSLQPA